MAGSERFGIHCIRRAVVLQGKAIAGIDAKADYIIHPVGFLTQEVENMQKVFVGIATEWTTDGKIIPTLIRWEDSCKFAVERVLDARQTASFKVYGTGI